MNRRECIRLFSGLGMTAVTGCASNIQAPGAETRTPLPDETVSFPSGPKSPPKPPDPLTKTSVGEYVREYERRYVYNKLWSGPDSTVGVSCDIKEVEDIQVGYRVVVSCFGQAKTESDRQNDTVEYRDWFEHPITYFLDADSLIRKPETN